MGHRFTYYRKGKVAFSCKMKRYRCSRKTCRESTIYPPYCSRHTKEIIGVTVAPSRIPNAGLGLFATRNLKAHQKIAPLFGEKVNRDELYRRYGPHTAPYAVFTAGSLIDGACVRFVGQMSNTVVDMNGHSVRSATNAVIVSDEKNRPWIQATRPIAAGQEILTFYGDSYRVEGDTGHVTAADK